MGEARERLYGLAIEAVRRAEGSVQQAQSLLDAALREINDINLERELTAGYRTAALMSIVSRVFAELRAQRLSEDGPGTREQRPPIPGVHGGDAVKPRETPRSWLDIFMVSGKPIGDCTAEELFLATRARKRDCRFMELLLVGVPPTGTIRDYHSAEDAERAYDLATADADHLELMIVPEVEEPPEDEEPVTEEPEHHILRRRRKPPPTGPPEGD